MRNYYIHIKLPSDRKTENSLSYRLWKAVRKKDIKELEDCFQSEEASEIILEKAFFIIEDRNGNCKPPRTLLQIAQNKNSKSYLELFFDTNYLEKVNFCFIDTNGYRFIDTCLSNGYKEWIRILLSGNYRKMDHLYQDVLYHHLNVYEIFEAEDRKVEDLLLYFSSYLIQRPWQNKTYMGFDRHTIIKNIEHIHNLLFLDNPKVLEPTKFSPLEFLSHHIPILYQFRWHLHSKQLDDVISDHAPIGKKEIINWLDSTITRDMETLRIENDKLMLIKEAHKSGWNVSELKTHFEYLAEGIVERVLNLKVGEEVRLATDHETHTVYMTLQKSRANDRDNLLIRVDNARKVSFQEIENINSVGPQLGSHWRHYLVDSEEFQNSQSQVRLKLFSSIKNWLWYSMPLEDTYADELTDNRIHNIYSDLNENYRLLFEDFVLYPQEEDTDVSMNYFIAWRFEFRDNNSFYHWLIREYCKHLEFDFNRSRFSFEKMGSLIAEVMSPQQYHKPIIQEEIGGSDTIKKLKDKTFALENFPENFDSAQISSPSNDGVQSGEKYSTLFPFLSESSQEILHFSLIPNYKTKITPLDDEVSGLEFLFHRYDIEDSTDSQRDNDRRNEEKRTRQVIFNTILKGFYSKSHTDQVNIQVLVGPRGIGKTRLAEQFATQKDVINKYDVIFWIDASSLDRLRQSFARYAIDAFLHNGSHLSINSLKNINVIKSIYQALNDKQCLFIFDDAESYEQVGKYLPMQENNQEILFSINDSGSFHHVLITSRNRDFGNFNTLELGGFLRDEVHKLYKSFVDRSNNLRKLSYEDKSNDEIDLLAAEVGYNPLTLFQVFNYIEFHTLSIKEYFEKLRDFMSESKDWTHFHNPSLTYDSVEISIMQLSIKSFIEHVSPTPNLVSKSKNLLYSLCYFKHVLHTDEFLRSLFSIIFDNKFANDYSDETISLMVNTGLIFKRKQDMYSCFPVLQLVVQKMFPQMYRNFSYLESSEDFLKERKIKGKDGDILFIYNKLKDEWKACLLGMDESSNSRKMAEFRSVVIPPESPFVRILSNPDRFDKLDISILLKEDPLFGGIQLFDFYQHTVDIMKSVIQAIYLSFNYDRHKPAQNPSLDLIASQISLYMVSDDFKSFAEKFDDVRIRLLELYYQAGCYYLFEKNSFIEATRLFHDIIQLEDNDSRILLARSKMMLGYINLMTTEYNEAIHFSKDSLSLLDNNNNKVSSADGVFALRTLAHVDISQKKIYQAEKKYKICLKYLDSCKEEGQIDSLDELAFTLHGLSNLHSVIDQHDKASDFSKRAYNEILKVYAPYFKNSDVHCHPQVRNILIKYSSDLIKLNKLDKAIELYQLLVSIEDQYSKPIFSIFSRYHLLGCYQKNYRVVITRKTDEALEEQCNDSHTIYLNTNDDLLLARIIHSDLEIESFDISGMLDVQDVLSQATSNTEIDEIMISGNPTDKLLKIISKNSQRIKERIEQANALKEEILSLVKTASMIDFSVNYYFDGYLLNVATSNRHGSVVSYLIEQGHPVKVQGKKGITPLHLAAANGDERMVHFLLEHGHPIDVIDENGLTPLHYAVSTGGEEMVRNLLELGSLPEEVDISGASLLHYAASGGCQEVIRYLLGQGLTLDVSNSRGSTMIHYAAGRGHESVIRYLQEQGLPIEKKDKNGLTGLHLAAINGHEGIVRYLLDQDHPIDVKDKHGSTPLHFAADRGHEGVVCCLLEQGHPLEVRDKDNLTALHFAASNGHEGVVEYLLAYDHPSEVVDKLGRTPLLLAAQNEHLNIFKLLARKNPEYYKNDYGDNPIHWAIRHGLVALAKSIYLREKKTKRLYNSYNFNKYTPFLIAALFGQTELVGWFIKKHASVTRKTVNGDSALILSVLGAHLKTTDLLLKEGLDPKSKNEFGLSAIDIAFLTGDYRFISLFKIDQKFLNENNILQNKIKGLKKYILALFQDPNKPIKFTINLINRLVHEDLLGQEFISKRLLPIMASHKDLKCKIYSRKLFHTYLNYQNKGISSTSLNFTDDTALLIDLDYFGKNLDRVDENWLTEISCHLENEHLLVAWSVCQLLDSCKCRYPIAEKKLEEHKKIVDNLQKSFLQKCMFLSPKNPGKYDDSRTRNAYLLAMINLNLFAKWMGLDNVTFDNDNTCILDIHKEYSLHLTFEPNSRRLYLYAALLDGLPKKEKQLMYLYERLLEGAILGGDMLGGGVGVSVDQGIILMHCTLEMSSADATILIEFAEFFIACVEQWRQVCQSIKTEKELPKTSLSTWKKSAHFPWPKSKANEQEKRDAGRSNAKGNIRYFGKEIGLEGILLDKNNTCILGIDDEFSIHLTFEPNSCRLYLYSPLLNGLPQNQRSRLLLYEDLLTGSMLGGQMAGGGVGVSVRDELVLMHCTLNMLTPDDNQLTRFFPLYLEKVAEWRERLSLLTMVGKKWNKFLAYSFMNNISQMAIRKIIMMGQSCPEHTMFIKKALMKSVGIVANKKWDNPQMIMKIMWIGNVIDQDGNSLLYYAIIDGAADIVEILLKYGADRSETTSGGLSLLHLAVKYSTTEVVAVLCHSGANLESKCHEGVTPLCLAVMQGSLAIVELLTAAGADKAVRFKGNTLSELAFMRNHLLVYNFLENDKQVEEKSVEYMVHRWMYGGIYKKTIINTGKELDVQNSGIKIEDTNEAVQIVAKSLHPHAYKFMDALLSNQQSITTKFISYIYLLSISLQSENPSAYKVVNCLMHHFGSHYNLQGINYDNLLFLAIQKGDIYSVLELIGENEIKPKYLLHAIRVSSISMQHLLLTHGVDINEAVFLAYAEKAHQDVCDIFECYLVWLSRGSRGSRKSKLTPEELGTIKVSISLCKEQWLYQGSNVSVNFKEEKKHNNILSNSEKMFSLRSHVCDTASIIDWEINQEKMLKHLELLDDFVNVLLNASDDIADLWGKLKKSSLHPGSSNVDDLDRAVVIKRRCLTRAKETFKSRHRDKGKGAPRVEQPEKIVKSIDLFYQSLGNSLRRLFRDLIKINFDPNRSYLKETYGKRIYAVLNKCFPAKIFPAIAKKTTYLDFFQKKEDLECFQQTLERLRKLNNIKLVTDNLSAQMTRYFAERISQDRILQLPESVTWALILSIINNLLKGCKTVEWPIDVGSEMFVLVLVDSFKNCINENSDINILSESDSQDSLSCDNGLDLEQRMADSILWSFLERPDFNLTDNAIRGSNKSTVGNVLYNFSLFSKKVLANIEKARNEKQESVYAH